MRINSVDISAAGHGRLLSGPFLVIGGAEDRAGDAGLLRTFVELSGGSNARIVLVTAASGTPSVAFTEYSAAFHRLGVPDIRELRQEQSKGEQTLTELALLQLGYGCHRRLIWAASTEQTSAIGVDIACDKAVTKQLLTVAGIPVPEGTVVHSAEEAVQAFDYLGAPVLVKPVSGHHGENVFVASTAEEVATAFGAAGGGGGLVLVESYVRGRDYRVLVAGDRIVAAELSPARVTGDGTSDIAALVDQVNADPRRGIGHDRPLTRAAAVRGDHRRGSRGLRRSGLLRFAAACA